MKKDVLLTRTQFRESVLERDSHQCVFCGEKTNLDAHHITERRLFTQEKEYGGYFISNGATVCETHHRMCESTEISTQQVREQCGITTITLPEHFYHDLEYDKWGNIVQANGTRLKGELFFDESVQKIIKPFLGIFVNYIKYPRTYHLPWTQSTNKDDKTLKDDSQFQGKVIVVTEKLDGENFTGYRDYSHARSIDSGNHESRNYVKNFFANFQHDIPEGWRICGENVFAKHAILYEDLADYFYGFSIWDEKNNCLSWQDSLEWFELLGITPAPVLYYGLYDRQKIKEVEKSLDFTKVEGYVIRNADSFSYRDFRNNTGKFVRQGHIQDVVHHWKQQKIIRNNLCQR